MVNKKREIMNYTLGWIFVLLGGIAFLVFCGAEARNASFVIYSFYAMLILFISGIILLNI